MTTFSELNRERCEAPSGFDHALSGWSLSDWYTAFMGEAGEAGNVIKKLNRLRDGLKSPKGEDYESLRAALGDELADAYIYLDLLFQAAEIDKARAVKEKFNKDSVKRKLSSHFMIHMLYSNIVTTRHSFNMRPTVEGSVSAQEPKVDTTTAIHPVPREFSGEQILQQPILKFFHYQHLPPVLMVRSKPFCDLARFLVDTTPNNDECTVALRKLLEAKDAAVRAAL